MPLSPKQSNILKLSIVLFSLTLTAFYLFSGHAETRTRHGYTNLIQTAVKGKKAVFVESLLQNEIDGPFDNRTLIELCRTREWTPGLIFKCEAPQGGIGNVRNVFLNCLRYTIEAGGSFPSSLPKQC